MIDNFAKQQLRQFAASLDELDNSLAFLRVATQVRPRLSPLLDWASIQGETKALISLYLNQKEVEPSALRRGALTTMGGSFEEFVRSLVEESIRTINSRARNYDSVPEIIRLHNVHKSGRALSNIMEPLDHLALDYTKLAVNLATCIPGATSYTLNAQAFSCFISNLTPDNLESVCKAINVRLDWDDLGAVKENQVMFSTSGSRATGKAVRGRLAEFVKLRNKTAHSGPGGVVISDTDIDSFIAFFRLFAPQLANLIATSLSKTFPSATRGVRTVR